MDGSTPMTNAQFRALLSTPRPRYASEGEGSTAPKSAGGFKPPAPKKEREQKFKKPAPKPKPGAIEEDDGTPAYRDRAKERREGRVDEAYLEQLEKAGVNPEALGQLDAEHTKFFGGDASLSHLVKGLDYALLQREREKLGKAAAGADEEDAAAPGPGSNIFAQQQVDFATPRGRAVYNALFRKPPNRRHLIREMFLPRRTAFVYDFDPETGGGDVPTTLRRSKADCPPVQERVLAAADGAVLERIAAVMAYLHSGGGGRGGRKAGRTKEAADFIRNILAGGSSSGSGGGGEADTKVHDNVVVKHQSAITGAAKQQQPQQPQQPQAPAGPVDEDDIFGDAGTDYVPEMPPPKPAAARPAADAAGGADGEADMEIEEGEVGLPPPPAASTSRQQQQHNPWGSAGQAGYGASGGAAGAGGGYGGYGDAYGGGAAGYGGDYYGQGGGYGGYPAPPGGGYPAPPDAAAAAAAAAAGYQQQQQQQPPQQQQKVAQEEPKWRVRPSKAAILKGFDEEAYGELFPEAAGGAAPLADSDDEGGGKPGEGPEGAAGAAAGKAGKKGAAGAAAGGGGNDANKIHTQVQAIQRVFEEKGYGHEAAFKKERKLDVGATPARAKRLKL